MPVGGQNLDVGVDEGEDKTDRLTAAYLRQEGYIFRVVYGGRTVATVGNGKGGRQGVEVGGDNLALQL